MPIPIIPVIRDFSVPFLHFSLIPPFKTHFRMMSNEENEEWRRMNDQSWLLSQAGQADQIQPEEVHWIAFSGRTLLTPSNFFHKAFVKSSLYFLKLLLNFWFKTVGEVLPLQRSLFNYQVIIWPISTLILNCNFSGSTTKCVPCLCQRSLATLKMPSGKPQ